MTTLGSVGLFGILFNPGRFTLFKSYIVEATGLSRDALHMHFGIALTLILFVILGRRIWSALVAWLVLFVLTIWGERLDYLSDPWFTEPEKQWAMAIHDIVNTMFWPTLLLLLGGWLFKPRPSGVKSMDKSGDSADKPLE